MVSSQVCIIIASKINCKYIIAENMHSNRICDQAQLAHEIATYLCSSDTSPWGQKPNILIGGFMQGGNMEPKLPHKIAMLLIQIYHHTMEVYMS